MTSSRRSFLGGAAALAVWPHRLFGKEETPPDLAGIWERPDGSATDTVMVRRLFLDLAGRLPTKDEAKAYAESPDPGKRAALADRLLASREFADYWTMRFCDILRVKSEFPVNLWPNAVYVYHARIRAFVEKDEAWDRFGRALLVSQGSNFRDAEVNFFRATDRRNPEGWTEAVARTFLGVEPDALDPGLRASIAASFSGLRVKSTREWKEEIVYVEGDDGRKALCDILFRENAQLVADAFLSRLRGWIFGPSAAAGRSALPVAGVKSTLRGLVLSGEYARGSVTGGFPARRLDAEVLDDAFCALSGTGRNYVSPAPEPFTFLPPERPTVAIEDGSVSSGFLSLFGRPARDTGRMDERGSGVTAKQRLYLFNSGSVYRKLSRMARTRSERLAHLYWSMLSRPPSAYEQAVVKAEFVRRRADGKGKANYGELMRDVAWCIVNTKEFLFRI